MRICALRNTEEAVLATLAAAEFYAEEKGFKYDKKHYMVTDAEDKPQLYFMPQGRKFFLVLCADDFTCPTLLAPIGVLHLSISSDDAAAKILRQRSDVDISCADKGRYYLHDGAIMAMPMDNELEIRWYADPDNGITAEDVTKHVAAILGLLKGCVPGVSTIL